MYKWQKKPLFTIIYNDIFVYRGLLDDNTFHDLMVQLQDEPIPYFNQYSTKSRPSTSPATPAPSIGGCSQTFSSNGSNSVFTLTETEAET